MVRNRPAGDLAALLTDPTPEDQVVFSSCLEDAAAVFEYLSHDAQETLLKAMAQEDIAALLNNMAPDDRTMFLEELPAAATRQLLSLLTPAERTVALSLLGYPEDSVGRLMTPQYVAARESDDSRSARLHPRPDAQRKANAFMSWTTRACSSTTSGSVSSCWPPSNVVSAI
jgi:magnesium transporter